MKRQSLEGYLVGTILLVSVPVSIIALVLAYQSELSPYLISLGLIVQTLVIFSAAYNARNQLSFRLRGLATVIEAAMLGDYSLKARAEAEHSSLSDLVKSINRLSRDLSREKISTEEKSALLEKIVEQIQVGIITSDSDGRIFNHNLSARRILGLKDSSLLEHTQQLPIDLAREIPSSKIVSLIEGDSQKRVFIQQDSYRDEGEQRQLIILTEMDYLLRQEQFKSWEDLIRVISHEINNSLAPICSLSESLKDLVKASALESDIQHDMLQCADVIAERARSLTNFIGQYRNLSKLEAPVTSAVPVKSLIESVLPLFRDQNIRFNLQQHSSQQDYICKVDRSQIQQVIINLVKNAAEAMRAPGASDPDAAIEIDVERQGGFVTISVQDRGTGIKNLRNVFVPFYSTKKGGSGIGLALSRQIAELHGGTLSLANRPGTAGCIASITIPCCD